MYHLVARSVPKTLLFTTWLEGRALWDRVAAAAPGLDALVLMPDHLHLVHPADVRRPLAAALAGYARWRNAQRGEDGPAFARLPPAELLVDGQKVRRSLRYVALNPCRAGLAQDPLGWPLSSYRDLVGLAAEPVRRPHPDPHALHAYVSADPHVDPRGTALPRSTHAVPSAELVAHAVSALMRTPMASLRSRGRARALYLRAARVLCTDQAEIAAWAGCSRTAVHRAPAVQSDDVRRVARIVGDPRFWGLSDGDLRRLPGWSRYRGHR